LAIVVSVVVASSAGAAKGGNNETAKICTAAGGPSVFATRANASSPSAAVYQRAAGADKPNGVM